MSKMDLIVRYIQKQNKIIKELNERVITLEEEVDQIMENLIKENK